MAKSTPNRSYSYPEPGDRIENFPALQKSVVEALDADMETALNGDINAGRVKGPLEIANIPDLPASKTTSGTFDPARLPTATSSSSGAISAADKAKLDALSYKSGRRNITSLLDPAPVSGSLYIERRGDTVWLHADTLVPSATGDTLYLNVISNGFQITASAELPSAPRNNLDVAYNFRTYNHVLGIYGQATGKAMRGLVSWPTDQAIPTTLPGTPA